MNFIKKRSIIILSDGSLNFFYTNLIEFKQIQMYEKDYKNLTITQKQKRLSNVSFSDNIYKTRYKI